MSRYEYYNPNPEGHREEDCAIRAICKALGIDWRTAYTYLTAYGFNMAHMPDRKQVCNAFLYGRGFRRRLAGDDSGRYTLKDFCADYPQGLYVVVTSNHMVCVVDGCYYDSWDSGDEIPEYYWERVEQ